MSEQLKPPTICPNCKSPVDEIKGVSQKTNRPYHFWKCRNKNCTFTWNPPSQTELRHQEIMKALRLIYAELKKLETGIIEHPVETPEIPDEEIPIIEEKKELEKKMEFPK